MWLKSIIPVVEHIKIVANPFNKETMAKRMNTSQSAINRLLDPLNTSITLATIENAVAAMEKRLQIQVV